jgi:DNA recombination protein RmuC
MLVVYILISLMGGGMISYLIFSLLNKTKNIPKSDYESLNEKYIESNTQFKVMESKYFSQHEEYLKVFAKGEAREIELDRLLAKSSSLEADFKNEEELTADLSKKITDQILIFEIVNKEIDLLKQANAESSANNKFLTNSLNAQNEISKNQKLELDLLQEKLQRLMAENSTLHANHLSISEKLNSQKDEMSEIQKTSHLQFEKIANQILEEKSGKFTETNKANMEALLKPLGDNIDLFKKKVEETYDKESKQRFSLEEKVKELVEQTNKVSNEANNLASALKGQSKKQGDWGEVILESILQRSGLVKDREYFLQENIKDDAGNNLRPDVLIRLPDNRIIIIDSKVSLVAYDKFCSAETSNEQAVYLAEHLKSIRLHIEDLQSKKYDNIEASLDFTMMFIPIEPAYLTAIQGDQELWAFAYAKRILLISPTNLIACLKLMSDLWKRELQSKNALEIVKRGELLYEKFVSFVTSLEEIGKHINKSQLAYDVALGQLNSGGGNLIGQAQKLKDLGLKSSKVIPEAMLSTLSEDVELEPKLLKE